MSVKAHRGIAAGEGGTSCASPRACGLAVDCRWLSDISLIWESWRLRWSNRLQLLEDWVASFILCLGLLGCCLASRISFPFKRLIFSRYQAGGLVLRRDSDAAAWVEASDSDQRESGQSLICAILTQNARKAVEVACGESWWTKVVVEASLSSF